MSYESDGNPPGEAASARTADADAWALCKSEPTPELVELRAAIERFTATPATPRHPSELGGDLQALRHCIDLLELGFARKAAEFAATDAYDHFGSLSPEDWIRHACHVSGAAASSAVRVGEHMAALPESTAAVRDGRVGFAHLSLIATTAAAVQGPGAAKPFDERPLLDQALEHSVSRFRHDCAHARHAADAAGFLSEHLTSVEWSAFEMTPCEGGVVLRGRLDEVGGATLRAALEPLSKRGGAEDTRRRKRRMADALVELANHGLDASVLPSQAGQRPHLQLTAAMDTVLGISGAPAGELEFAGPVPAATVQRLACDASITRVLLDPKSAITNVGRALRVPAAATRRALHARDQGCVWPGCDRPPSWTSAHHLHHWAHGGKTDLRNLLLLCIRHHGMVHERGWTLSRSADGRLLALPPIPGVNPMPYWPLPPTADEEKEEKEMSRERRALQYVALMHPVQPPMPELGETAGANAVTREPAGARSSGP